MRLQRLEAGMGVGRLSHEDWCTILAAEPPLTEEEAAAQDRGRDAALIVEFGSLPTALVALRERAGRTRDPLDSYEAQDLAERLQEARLVA